MDAISLVLDGYLAAEAVRGNREGTASWRLISSPTDHLVNEAIIPCTTTEQQVVDALFTECRPGDLLRVTGHLALPDTADGVIRLHADSVEILWGVPTVDPPEDDVTDADGTDVEADRNAAIHTLAEALTGLGHQAPGQSIRLRISPNHVQEPGLEHCHSIDITPATAHRLADQIDAMNCYQHSERPDTGTALYPETVAELAEVFEGINLVDLTRAVLNATRPEHRLTVIRAMDEVFGEIPDPEDTGP
ncbi:hypothetical protein [Streptomyces xinghaiensis]|uniref:hypothetical protein n=1 Tax=Streptomyces xinghaiensis TaxID=1038928 RepID=UPI0002D54769|nr:hypothetical protein [Streptomyces xinghaiensis]MZE76752.1 hypothetical protein [Streptomyces sp. SID5475]